MTEPARTDATADLGAYCREIEACLTRENAGHLVRIVGPAFDLVRQWAHEGIPLSVVFQGIAQKAERHRAGRSAYPLRLEFCEADVRALFDHWRRAVGVSAAPVDDGEGGQSDAPDGGEADRGGSRPPSLTKHLDRALARLRSACGRMDIPDAVRELAARQLDAVVALREQARGARGEARAQLVTALPVLQAEADDAARQATPSDVMTAVTRQAETELGAYRDRLRGDAWQRAVDVTIDRLLRDRFGLPTLEM